MDEREITQEEADRLCDNIDSIEQAIKNAHPYDPKSLDRETFSFAILLGILKPEPPQSSATKLRGGTDPRRTRH